MDCEAVGRLACKTSNVDKGVMMNAWSSIKQEFLRSMMFMSSKVLGKEKSTIKRI